MKTTYQSFPMIAEMALWDINGRCRCPACGRYRNRTRDFSRQSTSAEIRTPEVRAHVHTAPLCNQCRGSAGEVKL